jgi:flagellar biosynthesis protein FliQ
MTTAAAVDWFRSLLWTSVLASGPAVLATVVIGLVMAILQAATQVNDQSVAFAPKALGIVIALAAGGPFMLTEMIEFTHRIFAAMARL